MTGPGRSSSAPIVVSAEVGGAVASGAPVVALESTIFSEFGLPSPANREALDRVLAALGRHGAVPALTAVLDGLCRVGVESDAYDRICGPAVKVAARDLGKAIAENTPYGATTVSASVTLAAAAGVSVFATGGIGGVHRGADQTGDISADLGAIARHPVVTVTAGAKVFLDLRRTVEHLEMLSVPVIGFGTDEFPAFHARTSGVGLSARVDTAAEAAAIARAHWALGGGGVVLACPIPEEHAIDADELQAAVDRAIERVSAQGDGPVGPDVTPAILAELASVTGGDSVVANLALAENNASVAAEVALALSLDR